MSCRPLSRVIAMLATSILWLEGCAISTPVRMQPPRPGDRPDDVLVVSLSHATVDPANRAAFDRYTQLVADSLPSHPGLVMYSIRRQVFGPEAWTMTAWTSAEARTRFVESAIHRRAMAEGRPALVAARFKQLELRRDQLPLDWDRALQLLADAEVRY